MNEGTKPYYVKAQDKRLKFYEVVGEFDNPHDANQLRVKLNSGAGGLFGLYHKVWVDTKSPVRRRNVVHSEGTN